MRLAEQFLPPRKLRACFQPARPPPSCSMRLRPICCSAGRGPIGPKEMCRLVLRSAQRNLPFGAAVVVIKSDGVGNLKVAVDCAIEAGFIAGMAKLRGWGVADWANEGHGYASQLSTFNVDPLTKKEGRYSAALTSQAMRTISIIGRAVPGRTLRNTGMALLF
jgi:hypothetical protein